MLKPKNKKRFHLNNALRKYYRAYFNDNFLRNFRFLFDKTQSFMKDGKVIEYDATSLSAFKYGKFDTSNKKAPNWILQKRRMTYGTLAGEITYFKNLDDFKSGSIEKRFCDRIFIDFDIDNNDKVKVMKEEFKRAHKTLEGKERDEILDILQQDFRDLIFNSHLLEDVFKESKSLCDYLSRYGLKPYLVFSGSKGFHINIFFDEMQLRNLSQISQTLALSYSKELNLHYIDFNVFDRDKAHKRLQRLQYGIHSKTNLMTRPLSPDIAYDEMLDTIQSKKVKPIDFDFNEMKAPEGFNKMLMKLDKEISFRNAQRQIELDMINTEKKLAMQKKYGKNYKSFQEIDLRDIANSYGIDGKRQGDKLIVSCPFHNDKHPSGVVFPSRFHCSTCNLTLNYYDFISRLEGTNDKEQIMKIASKFL